MFNEHPVFIPVPIASALISSLIVDQHPVAALDNEPIEQVNPEASNVVMDIPLRRLKRSCRPAISNDCIVYLQEHEYDMGDVLDMNPYRESMVNPQSNFWIDAMKDEISMSQNKVWSFVVLLDGYRPFR